MSGEGTTPQLEGRNGEIYRKVTIYRWTYEKCSAHFGVSRQRIAQIVAEIRKDIPAHDLAEMRQQSLELYAELTARALEIADLVPAPVCVGKDGQVLIDPDTGQVVRDYSGKLAAMDTARKMDLETRKLMGLDAAQKAEVASTVRYELVGVSPEDLT